jgi:superoxide reductase
MQEIKIYKCEKCGKIVIELQTSSASVVCCGEKMKKFCVNTNNGSTEKHVPCIVSEKQNAITMQVGEIKHDMSEAHFIN